MAPAPGDAPGAPADQVVACVDFGSTFTKAALVDVRTGELLGTADHPTTVASDVLEGWEACRAHLAQLDARAARAPVLACSSAGGGLRVAVLGNEELVTAEAGRRVALSSGGRVVHVGHGQPDAASYDALEASRPDVVLLVGGTDGGNPETLLTNARTLAVRRWAGPVVVAGDVAVRDEVAAVLEQGATPHVLADNVMPRIGELAPGSARAAIREMFLAHVIGGKQLSGRPELAAMVRGATPDLVLSGVELLGCGLDAERPGTGDVVVVDVGGATTDVHSVLELASSEAGVGDHGAAGLSREVVADTPVARTVEGDLGMRWSAEPTVAEGVRDGFLDDDTSLAAAAERRRRQPDYLPDTAVERRYDEALAGAAAGVAVRRHAGRARVVLDERGRVVERTGRDLRQVALLVGSGGVLRAGDAAAAARVLASATGPNPDGWQLPEQPRVVVDRDYVLAAAGLLREVHPDAAYRLLGCLRG